MLQDIMFIIPELLLVEAALALLIIGVIGKDHSAPLVTKLSLVAMAVAAYLLLTKADMPTRNLFNDMLVVNGFTQFTKGIIVLVTMAVTWMTLGFYRSKKQQQRFEYPVLVLLALAGMLCMLSSNNLLSFYMGLEMQSLALYVLTAIHRDNTASTEAGVKYFVLGALTSGLLLYGCSFIYGFTGTMDFALLAGHIKDGQMAPGLLLGFILVLVAFCFKISAVPFHMWTPDVYEGAPTPVTALLATAPKVAALALLIRFLVEPFGMAAVQWQQILVVVSAASMALGALGALRQQNIKRLMAYSSIGHIGYVLMGIATHTTAGVYGVLVYLVLYVAMNAGAFGCILMMQRRVSVSGEAEYTEMIPELAGLAKLYPWRALALAILLLSMAGIPPLAGFWGKWFVFKAAIDAGMYGLAVLGVLSSVVAAYYYIRIIKVMYFDESNSGFSKEIQREITLVAGGAALFNLLFFIYPVPLLGAVQSVVALMRLSF